MRHKGQVYAVTQENAESSFAETSRVVATQNSSTAFQITNDNCHQQKVESSSNGEDKLSTEIEVLFHRSSESPEQIKPFYPDDLEHKPLKHVKPNELEHKPLKPANLDQLRMLSLDLGPKRRSIRANGRSISREITTKNVVEMCRRHASLPNVESFKEIEKRKRHSINVVAATPTTSNERHSNFLTSSFFSTLLSDNENDTNDDDKESTDEVRLSTEDVRLSTEIVYKLVENVEEKKAAENGFLPEPALYRIESSNISGGPRIPGNRNKNFSRTQSCDLNDENSSDDFDAEKMETKEIFI
jgi:hypothetical protein